MTQKSGVLDSVPETRTCLRYLGQSCVWAHFLNLVFLRILVKRMYSLLGIISSLLQSVSILLHKISKHHLIFHNKFHWLKIPFNENIQLWPIPIWKSIHDPPYPKPRSYIPRYYHKFPAYCTTSCAPRHRFLTQQIPKVILLQQRSSIKIQLSS